MPLQQLCSSSGSKITIPFLTSSVHAQEVYNQKLLFRQMERCGSQGSSLSFSKDICRICHCEGDGDASLITPCYCSGSLRYVHQACLQQWVKSSDTKCCELCKFPFVMHSKVKPFHKWQRLEMSGVERRKILFSVLFHILAVTCVVWSLYVLIERTSEEVKNGELEWPFWTKLIVVAIGFTGSVVFMYVQCKMYIHLCRRWRAFNRVIFIQNVTDKVILNEMELPKVQSEYQNEAEKPFLALAVISNNPLSDFRTASRASCCAPSNDSPPPGAIWIEDSLQTNPGACYRTETNCEAKSQEIDALMDGVDLSNPDNFCVPTATRDPHCPSPTHISREPRRGQSSPQVPGAVDLNGCDVKLHPAIVP